MASGRLRVTIASRRALYRAYMPFIRNGGLFLSTDRAYELGDDVSAVLNLMGGEEPVPVSGKVVWVTPERAQGKRAAGIGVQFDGNGSLRGEIEARLAGFAKSDELTHTL